MINNKYKRNTFSNSNLGANISRLRVSRGGLNSGLKLIIVIALSEMDKPVGMLLRCDPAKRILDSLSVYGFLLKLQFGVAV